MKLGKPNEPISQPADEQPVQARTVFSFDDVMVQLWRQKVLNFVVVAMVGLLTIVWLHWVDREYAARMVVSPSEDTGSSGSGGSSKGFSDLVTWSGIDLSTGSQANPHEHYLQLLHSLELAELLQTNHGFLQHLYPTLWNKSRGDWTKPSGFVANIKVLIKRTLAMPKWSPPSEEDLANILKKRIDVKPIRNSSFTEIVAVHSNSQTALKLLTAIHMELDALLRQKAKGRVTGQIRYIKSKLETVRVVEHRKALTQLLVEQERKMMMISIDQPFAAKLVERPFAASKPSFPNTAVSILVGLLFGVAICIAVAMKRIF